MCESTNDEATSELILRYKFSISSNGPFRPSALFSAKLFEITGVSSDRNLYNATNFLDRTHLFILLIPIIIKHSTPYK